MFVNKEARKRPYSVKREIITDDLITIQKFVKALSGREESPKLAFHATAGFLNVFMEDAKRNIDPNTNRFSVTIVGYFNP